MDSGVDAAGLGQGKRPIVRLRPTVLITRLRLAGNAETVRMLKERYCHVAPFGHAAADALETGSDARFMEFGDWQVGAYNRAWTPSN